jgi:hypothetical protein
LVKKKLFVVDTQYLPLLPAISICNLFNKVICRKINSIINSSILAAYHSENLQTMLDETPEWINLLKCFSCAEIIWLFKLHCVDYILYTIMIVEVNTEKP